MSNPSSSADQRASRAPGSIGVTADGLPPQADLSGAERFISRHAPLLGPAASWFVRDLWRQAANHAQQESLQIIEHAHRYTPQRLERACQRALLHHLKGLPAIQFILAEHLDDASRHDAQDAAQLTFPFVDVERP